MHLGLIDHARMKRPMQTVSTALARSTSQQQERCFGLRDTIVQVLGLFVVIVRFSHCAELSQFCH